MARGRGADRDGERHSPRIAFGETQDGGDRNDRRHDESEALQGERIEQQHRDVEAHAGDLRALGRLGRRLARLAQDDRDAARAERDHGDRGDEREQPFAGRAAAPQAEIDRHIKRVEPERAEHREAGEARAARGGDVRAVRRVGHAAT